MFTLTSTSPAPLKGVIKVASPVRHLGPLTDVDGNKWHVEAIFGNCVCATPLSQLHSYFTDTSDAEYGFVSQTWDPYQTEIVSASAQQKGKQP